MTSSALLYFLSPILFWVGMLAYFKSAEKYRIIDRPNERSSHSVPTVRGGGIVFVLAMVLFALESQFEYGLFLIGFLALSAVSFIDDIRQMPKRLRLGVQLIAVILLIYQITKGDIIWWEWALYALLFTSGINFYNFMDGINGITAFYTLAVLGTCLYLQQTNVLIVKEGLIVLPLLATLVFSFYNARVRARCFAGDVGSVSLAFIIIFLVGLLCWQQQNLMYIWLLGIYWVDTILTIIQRIFMGQNILKGHRLHLYQFMANEGRMPHVLVSVIFTVAQLLLNVILLAYVIPGNFDPVLASLLFCLFFVSIYLPIKHGFSKKNVKKPSNQGKATSVTTS